MHTCDASSMSSRSAAWAASWHSLSSSAPARQQQEAWKSRLLCTHTEWVPARLTQHVAACSTNLYKQHTSNKHQAVAGQPDINSGCWQHLCTGLWPQQRQPGQRPVPAACGACGPRASGAGPQRRAAARRAACRSAPAAGAPRPRRTGGSWPPAPVRLHASSSTSVWRMRVAVPDSYAVLDMSAHSSAT